MHRWNLISLSAALLIVVTIPLAVVKFGLRQAELEKNFHAVLQAAFTKMDLVTRQEFDVQQGVLVRTRAKLEELEKQVAELTEKNKQLTKAKYVAITDNAEQLQVVVYRTAPDEELEPDQQRVVCKVPVFDFPGGGNGAGSNSLVGFRNSIIAQNTADYLFDWETGTLTTPGRPGMARIDIAPNGRGCTKVWTNEEVHTNMAPKLSTRNGLIYDQDRKYDATNDVYAVYWVALDFRTGKIVWEKLAGTLDASGPATFDNIWPAIGFGPNGALYGTNIGGVTMIRDQP